MSHDTSPKKLIYWPTKAVTGVAKCLTRFCDPSMRKKIVHHLDQGGEGLDPLVREAVEKLRATLPNKAEFSG